MGSTFWLLAITVTMRYLIIILFFIATFSAKGNKHRIANVKFVFSKNPSTQNINGTSGDIVSFSSIAAFRLYEGGLVNSFYLITERGKEGYFYYDTSDRSSFDNEGTVIVTHLGRRYKRVYDGEVNVAWFGAKGDGTSNDSDAFNKALTSKSNCIYIPYTDAGYRIANVAITKTVTFKGDNKFNSKIFPAANNASCFITQAPFVEYRDLYFDGVGTKNTTGIEHMHRISTVDKCFFSGLSRGIYNNKSFVEGGKPDEQTITNCRFRDCSYGIISEGNFINSKIFNSIFHGCNKSAIYCFDDSYNSSTLTTEGFVIESCLIYASGNKAENTAAIELRNVDFTFIRNSVIDINSNTSLSITNSQNCSITSTYISSPASTIASTKIIGNCSNTTFQDCQIYDCNSWGLEISGLAGRISDNIRVINCSGRLNKAGDISVNGGTNIWISNSNFYSNSQTNIQVNNSLGNTSLHIRSTNIVGAITKINNAINVDLIDCPTKPTTKIGTVIIADGQKEISFVHGLTVLPGQKVIILVNNQTNFEPLLANASLQSIDIRRTGNTGSITISFNAQVQ